MYKLMPKNDFGKYTTVERLTDHTFIPFNVENTDYIKFKEEVANGVSLEDENGTVMTQTEVDAFLKTIP